ncbi:hypothetical protein BGZ83_002576 [Gryganskiella cystojenkinii]|nr:hypothetical protein BGZ83_002576 [Gryganskiella cystojenkinii]
MIITAAIALNLVKGLVLNTPAPSISTSSNLTSTSALTTETTTTETETKIKKEKGPKTDSPPAAADDESKIPYVTLSDCHACPTPCPEEDHPHYPSYLKIDQEMPLLHSMKPYTRHVLISTGKDDWEAHIDDDKDSLAPYLQKAIDEGQAKLREEAGGKDVPRIVLTNSSRQCENWEGPGWQVIILPDQIVVNHVTPEQCTDFFDAFLRPPVGSVAESYAAEKESESKALEVAKEELTNGGDHKDIKTSSDSSVSTQAAQNGAKTTVVTTTTTTTTTIRKTSSVNGTTTSSSSTELNSSEGRHCAQNDTVRTVKAGNSTFLAHKWQPRAAIMICSHRKRDKRCGVTAPILQKEFKRILRSKDMLGDCEGDVEIWLVSHIGGHKFAGNVIVHKQEGMAVWYGRVDPCHCQAIVETTIEKNEVLKELFRGAMIGSFEQSRKKIAW